MGVQAFSGSFSSGQAGSHRHAAPYQGGISPTGGGRMRKQRGGRITNRLRRQTGGRGRPIRKQTGGRSRPVRRQTGGRGRPIRRQTGGGGGYVFASTGQPYNGQIVEAGGSFYTTTTGTIEGNSQKVMTSSEYNHNKPG